MNMFVTADNNWGISCRNMPLASIPAEEKTRLKEIAGHVIVYDAKYIDRLPGKQPLANTVNLVYTEGQPLKLKGAKTFQTIDELRFETAKYDTDEVYIISSEQLYREFLKDTDTVHVTKIDYAYDADAFFENLDKNPDFKLIADSDEQYCFDIVYSFLKYKRTGSTKK